jgi:hypothetical protein
VVGDISEDGETWTLPLDEAEHFVVFNDAELAQLAVVASGRSMAGCIKDICLEHTDLC